MGDGANAPRDIIGFALRKASGTLNCGLANVTAPLDAAGSAGIDAPPAESARLEETHPALPSPPMRHAANRIPAESRCDTRAAALHPRPSNAPLQLMA